MPRRFLLLFLIFGVGLAYFYTRQQAEPEQPAAESYRPPVIMHGTGVAVLPFQVADAAEAWLGDAMVHLLSARLGGNGSFRRINPLIVLSHVQRDRDITGSSAEGIAKSVGAQSYVEGRIDGNAEQLHVVARWHDVGRPDAAEQSVEGPLSDLPELVNRLGAALAANRVDPQQVRIARVEVVTSSDAAALREYVEAELKVVGGDYPGAMQQLQKAAAIDPQFALAYYRLAEVAAWNGHPEVADDARQSALLLSNRLPVAERAILDADLDVQRHRSAEAIARYKEIVAAAPEEWTVWLRLSEINPDRNAARAAARKAYDLLPGQPVVQHAVAHSD